MRDGDSSGPSRRSVLKTTGLALATAVGTVGTASASHVSAGDCAVTVADAHLHEQGCPLQDRFATISSGTSGQVHDTCVTDAGDERVLFSPNRTVLPAGWVNGLALEPC